MSGSSFIWAVWSCMLNKYCGAVFLVLNTFTDTKTVLGHEAHETVLECRLLDFAFYAFHIQQSHLLL